jgi:hypothetical protein
MDNDNIIIFNDRSFDETEGGYYDIYNNYITNDGDYWDRDKNYYNKEGFDKHFGFYDEYGVYVHGPNWNEEMYCYEDEMEFYQDKEHLIEERNNNIVLSMKNQYNIFTNWAKDLRKDLNSRNFANSLNRRNNHKSDSDESESVNNESNYVNRNKKR